MNMKIMQVLILLAALLLFLFIGSAFAGTATVNIGTVPTKRTDGSAITGALTYRYEAGTCPALATVIQTQTTAATTYTFTLPAGTYCFQVRAIEAGGGTSDPSNIPSKVIPVAPPEPPTITVSSIGYVLELRAHGVYRLVRNGSVPLGVPCTPIPGNTTSWMGIAGDRIGICGPG